eukprot:CAMPEP_0197053562 /NCGR_PEP_ID=MMETSP1384-20130603/27811_1 /TAXON_ID=29189 /ORGANISM="Ammonia sp." /LENGTH=183 /DNA_ID=CAMNT_0042486479 /DNA_START=11 /DNA_END=562 /DNA_ORIENTATION=-
MVNTIFAKNWLGIQCSDDELRQIPYPKFETGLHVSLKGMQAGAVVGYFGSRLTLSVQKFALKRPSMKDFTAQQFLEKSCKTSRNFMFAGLIMSIPMFLAHGMGKSVDEEGYYDRAYRIRYNVCQLNVDRASLALGTVYGAMFVVKSRSFLLGFPKGVCWGTILAAAYNNFNKAQEMKETMNAD